MKKEYATFEEGLAAFHQAVAQARRPKAKPRERRGGCEPYRKFVSHALAVHPKQAKKANARARRHGIAVHYDRKGVAHVPSRHEYLKLQKLEGVHENDDRGHPDC